MTRNELDKLEALVKEWEVYYYHCEPGDYKNGVEMGFRSASDELCGLLVDLEAASKNQ